VANKKGESVKTIIIAEAASNHNGEISIAKEMIHAAKDAGADMIKFQSYLGKNVSEGHPDKERFCKVNLSDDDHWQLLEECKKVGIEFFTTCFDIARIDFLKCLGLKYIKIASYDFSSHRLMVELAKYFDHLIVSAGGAKNEEIQETVRLLNETGKKFTLLHCVTLYPTPSGRANLGRINYLKSFTPRVGFSDHTLGVEVPKAAIAMGAVMVEKHFTLDKKMEGKSHQLACDPKELKELVEYSSFVESVYGDASDNFGEDERKVRNFYHGLLGGGV
jgi:N,N'-diacetyllegionaminate synthase